MNVFFLNSNSKLCAQYHVDRHVVSQLKEAAQLLSTAHRILDGTPYIDTSSGRKIKRWKLEDNTLESLFYKATHVNHPSAVWVRQSAENYMWLSKLLWDLSDEYTYRYGKVHKCTNTGLILALFDNVPKNIPHKPFTEPTCAMPDQYKVAGDSIKSYHNYYNGNKRHMFKWKNREVPYFITGEV